MIKLVATLGSGATIMKNHAVVMILGVILAIGLVTSPMLSYANSVNIKAAPPKKKQKFKLKQKATFNFDKKFATKNKPSFGNKVKMKAGKDPVTGKKKPAAAFNFGELRPTATGGHDVSIELVSLSLTSVSPVSLAPFGKDFSQKEGHITLSLLQTPNQPATKTRGKVKRLDRKNKKGEMKFDDLKKKLKVDAKPADGTPRPKSKALATLKFSALDIPFSFASPITVTEPGFCMDSKVTGADGGSAQGAEICLAPIVNPVPIPGALGLFGIGLASLFLMRFGSRRKIAS